MSPLGANDLYNFLQKMPLFADLDGRALESVIGAMREEDFGKGAIVCTEGEPGHTMYVVLDGLVEVLRNDARGNPRPIVRLGPGECFGEMALVEQQARAASVLVLENAKLLSLRDSDLYELLKKDNYAFVILLQNLCRLLSRRLRKADGRIAEFLSKQGGSAAGPDRGPQKGRRRARG